MGLINKFIGLKIVERLKRKMLLISRVHLKLKKLSASSSEEYRLVKLLQNFNFDLVIDVGGNTGQFAESLLDFGFKGKIITFEPTLNCYNELIKRSMKYISWDIAQRCALGNFNGKVDINIAENSLFSSIKNIKNQYVKYNSSANIKSTEKVDVFTLDSLRVKYFDKNNCIFLKIDTQGFEKEVLEGATELLNNIKGIKIELPLIPIYSDVEWDIKNFLDLLYDLDFICVSLQPVAVNNSIGVVNEVDGIFIKKYLLENI